MEVRLPHRYTAHNLEKIKKLFRVDKYMDAWFKNGHSELIV